MAKDAYEKVLKETPNHAKALQQLGWLYHSSMGNQETAINYLMRSIDAGSCLIIKMCCVYVY
jgi:general transcriptional corepressor CYC8